MKTFVWPTGSQNTRSAFDWNDLGSILNNNSNRNSKRSKWSFEEEPEETVEEEKAIDPVVQDVVNYAKSNFAQQVYMIKVQSGLSEKEIIILIKAFLTGFKTIAEANMSYRLQSFVEKTTGYKTFDAFDLSDNQRVQAIDLFIEFLNSKL